MREDKPFPVLSITNPNKAWVSEQIDALTKEWIEWNAFCQNIEDSPDFNPRTCSEAIKDGYENMRKHELLREKTLVLLRNHFSGAEFPPCQASCRVNQSHEGKLAGGQRVRCDEIFRRD